jgi:CHAD domain-containing protein
VAPLAATLATSVALGVGLVLARGERERRRAQARVPRDRLGLLAGEPLADGLRRMAVAQLDLAIELLGGGADERAVHETRKAIKRLRALLRVLRGELGERAYERENAALRGIARSLSQARDTAVMLATLDALIERHPRRLARRRGVRALRRRLAEEAARVQRQTLAAPGERAELLGELHALRWRISAWPLPARAGLELVEEELRRLYAQGRRRGRGVRRREGERTLAMHRWRKRVKDLRYATEMLERRDARGGRAKPAGGREAAAAKRLRKLAARADALGELLGEDHDLAVLGERLRAGAQGRRRSRGGRAKRRRRAPSEPAGALWQTGPRTRRALLKAIAKRQRKLRRRALRRGARLYEDKPGRFVRSLRAAHRDGQPGPRCRPDGL